MTKLYELPLMMWRVLPHFSATTKTAAANSKPVKKLPILHKAANFTLAASCPFNHPFSSPNTKLDQQEDDIEPEEEEEDGEKEEDGEEDDSSEYEPSSTEEEMDDEEYENEMENDAASCRESKWLFWEEIDSVDWISDQEDKENRDVDEAVDHEPFRDELHEMRGRRRKLEQKNLFSKDDEVVWTDLDDKQAWIESYHAKKQQWKQRFGCSIHAEADPWVYQTMQRIQQTHSVTMTRNRFFKLLIVISFVAQAIWLMYASSKDVNLPQPRNVMHQVGRSVSLVWGKIKRGTFLSKEHAAASSHPKERDMNQEDPSKALLDCRHACREVLLHRKQVHLVSVAMNQCNHAVEVQKDTWDVVHALSVRGDLLSLQTRWELAIKDYKNGLDLLEDEVAIANAAALSSSSTSSSTFTLTSSSSSSSSLFSSNKKEKIAWRLVKSVHLELIEKMHRNQWLAWYCTHQLDKIEASCTHILHDKTLVSLHDDARDWLAALHARDISIFRRLLYRFKAASIRSIVSFYPRRT